MAVQGPQAAGRQVYVASGCASVRRRADMAGKVPETEVGKQATAISEAGKITTA